MKKEFVITKATDPFREFARSAAEEEAAKAIAAVAFDGPRENIDSLAVYELDGEPFLAVDREKRRVVANEKIFGDLRRQDATRPDEQERREIGLVREKRLVADPARLFCFLLESQIVQTYWHVEARLTLRAFTDSPDEAVASFDGEHIYFTNEKNEERYRFSMHLNKKSGMMWIKAE